MRELHQFHGGGVDRSGRGKVHNGINIGVLGYGLADVLVHWQQRLAGTPVHLAHELTAESVDDTSDRGRCALADEVEVKHTLNSSGLQAVDEASCLVVKKGVFGARRERAARSCESLDLVVGRKASRRGAIDTVGRG